MQGGAGVVLAELTAGDWLVLARHELFLFAATFFLVGALDEMAVDLSMSGCDCPVERARRAFRKPN